MTDPDIEAWQLTILVTAAIVLVEMAVNSLLRRRLTPDGHRHLRTAALAALLLLSVIVFVAALGPSLADELSSVAAAVAAVVALWLTYRSYHSPRGRNSGGTAAPAPPPRTPSSTTPSSTTPASTTPSSDGPPAGAQSPTAPSSATSPERTSTKPPDPS